VKVNYFGHQGGAGPLRAKLRVSLREVILSAKQRKREEEEASIIEQ